MTRYTVRAVPPGRPSFVWSVITFVVIVGALAMISEALAVAAVVVIIGLWTGVKVLDASAQRE